MSSRIVNSFLNRQFYNSAKCQNKRGQTQLSNDHPYITSTKGLGGWGRKMVIFADVQYCIYADIVGGSEKVQKYADVIQGWSGSDTTGSCVRNVCHFVTSLRGSSPVNTIWGRRGFEVAIDHLRFQEHFLFDTAKRKGWTYPFIKDIRVESL